MCGYVPSQLRSAYGVSSTRLTGKVRPSASSIPTRRRRSWKTPTATPAPRRPGFAAGQFTQKLPAKFSHGALCDAPGLSVEENARHPGLPRDGDGCPRRCTTRRRSCLDVDLLATLARVVDDNRVDIVSNSWGGYDQDETSGDIAAYEQVAPTGRAARDLIPLVVRRRWRRAALHRPSADRLSGVGSMADRRRRHLHRDRHQRQDELADRLGHEQVRPVGQRQSWVKTAANPFWYGSGGGYSTLFNRPAYQHGVVTGGAPAGRAVPDVAMNGDPITGMLVGQTETFPHGVRHGETRWGGTSLSSPLMAGMLADRPPAHQERGRSTRPVRVLNPALYAQARAHAGTLTDVKGVHSGDGNVRPAYVNGITPAGGILYGVRTFNQDSSLVTKPGWDDVTGLGTPNALFLTAFGN